MKQSYIKIEIKVKILLKLKTNAIQNVREIVEKSLPTNLSVS